MGNLNGYARDDLASTWRILGEWLNLYATIVALGVLNLLGVAALPNSLDVLSDLAVLGIVGFMYLVEFFADNIPGVDSVWDATHTLICGPAGALLLAAALLGGSAVALGSRATQTDSRVIVNISPELVSNWIVLLLET